MLNEAVESVLEKQRQQEDCERKSIKTLRNSRLDKTEQAETILTQLLMKKKMLGMAQGD